MPNRAFHADLVRVAISACLCLVGWLASSTCSGAAEPKVVAQHTRDFRISVDGKPRGTQTMTFARRSDGSETVRGEAEVTMNFVVYRYRYASNGTEVWKDGRLIELANESDYNGDKYVIQGSATTQALHYEVNGEAQKAPPDIWVASYWREPESKRVGQKVRLLDSDKGRQMIATIERVGAKTITIDSAPVKVTHYRMRGDVEVDVWYDSKGIIVRQESMESNHKTLLELEKIHQQ